MPRKKGWKKGEARKVVLARNNGGRPVLGRGDKDQSQVYGVATPALQSPVILQATESPVILQATGSPVILQATGSPVILQATGSPVILQATGSPVILQATANHELINSEKNTQLPKQTCDFDFCYTAGNKASVGLGSSMELSKSGIPASDMEEIVPYRYDTPPNSKLLFLGSFNQADSRFSFESRGSQCTVNALCSLIYAQFSDFVGNQCLDNILIDGDRMYNERLSDLKKTGIFNSKLLNFDELPEQVTILNQKIEVVKSDVITGLCVQQFGNIEFPSMHQALHTAFQKSSHLLFMIGSVCSAVFKKDNEFYFFDSHSHGSDGMSTEDGKSILVSFHCLEDLVTFMYAVYDSMRIDTYSQFDLLPVHLRKTDSCSVTAQLSDIKENNNNTRNLKQDAIPEPRGMWQQVQHNWKNSTRKECNCNVLKNKGKHGLEQMNRSEVPRNETDNRTLIGKYFRDQKRKLQDRQEYQRKYKQKQRESLDYKFVEKQRNLIYKRKARQSDNEKIKERKSSLESKRKARQSVEFKLSEINAKRQARELDEIKIKNRMSSLASKRKARESEENKIKEREASLSSRRKARQSDEFKLSELCAKRQSRELDEIRIKDRKSSLVSKRKARESEDNKIKEREASLTSKRKARESEENKIKEREASLASKRKARQSDEFKLSELCAKRQAREFDEIKAKDRMSCLKSKRKARESDEYKLSEICAKRQARELDVIKLKDRESSLKSRRKARSRMINPIRESEAIHKRQKRQIVEFKEREATMQRMSKQKSRSNVMNLEKERLKKQQWRSVERNRAAELSHDWTRKASKRRNPVVQENEGLTAKRRKYGSNVNECIELFHKSISKGPTFVCSCCHQTWFRESVVQVKCLSDEQQKKFLTKSIYLKNCEWICITCKSNIFSGKVPKLSVLNGMGWPSKPDELDLFPLEERLIALRIPFMQIRELPRGRQLSVKGNVVNVPVDIQPVINALPRPLDENVTVAVELKKRLSFKSCVLKENIRPMRVLLALNWLMKHSELYKNAKVTIDKKWIKEVTASSKINEFVSKDYAGLNEMNSEPEALQQYSTNDTNSQTLEQYDSDAEENTEENIGNIDTLLDDSNLENRNNVFTFAPGDGQQPLSLYNDKDAEFLCFPSLFCGQKRKDNEERIVSVHYSDVAKWELRSEDRRAANSVPNIFFKLKKIQMKQLNDKVNIAVRRCQTGRTTITASQARDSNCVDNIVKKDEGFYIFKQLRNSPAYLETKKKDVFAMIRQLGLPTWFMSLSSADTRWDDLLKILATLNKKVNYTDDQIKNLTWEQKIRLIQLDPITCSRYFDHRVQEFIKLVLKSEHMPLGKLTDYFYRVEFQQRGSPHIHMLMWVEGAPLFNVDSNEDITAYVDQYLQCSLGNDYIKHLVDLQIHKHSQTCRKKKDKICRFGYPLPPLPYTMVLDPLTTEKDKYKKLYQILQKKMNDEKNGFDISYSEFLKTVVQMSEKDYILCIRSSLNSSKVFLKRNPNEIRVNLYNENVLKAWKANLDIQFVLDPYACAMYIVSYISKSQRGMSNLLYAAAKEARDGNLDIRRQVRHIGNIFSNSVEVSAQEAVYLILQMPLTKSTRDVVFVNTSTAEKRIQLLKSKSELDELPDDSTEIMSDNVIKRYSKRPMALEHWCLADYVSQLDIVYPEQKNDNNEETNDDLATDSEATKEFDENQTILTLRNGIVIKRRSNRKVIRYVHFNRKTDEENFCREKLLLFYPWRNEETDLLHCYRSYKESYETMKHMLENKSKDYEHYAEELELARDLAEADYDEFDNIAPGTQQVEAETAEEESQESDTFIYFNPDRAVEHREYDIGIEIGCSVSTAQIGQNENILADEKYRMLIRCLNTKQRQFYNHVVHWIKTNDEPLYAFLSGGAGVGKSVVVRALYQTLYRFLNLKEGENSDDVRILLCAYTGKAAFNINGSTISSAFKQKYKQADQTLTCDNLNTFRSKYRELKVVIIDEISMVSNTMLSFIDQRLQELKGRRTPFGGVSIIAVGDLYQLRPVSGDWVFNDLKKNAAALSCNLWKDHFTMFELTEIMRQKDDFEFAELLNRLRENALTSEDKLKLTKCEVVKQSGNYQKQAPHLFAENFFMHVFNDSMINSMQTEKVVIGCHDFVISPKLSKQKQDEAIKKLPTDPNQTANLHCSLTIVIDMIYDLTVNTNTEDGLANGVSCVVKYIEHKQKETNRPSIIWVQMDDPNVGTETRAKYQRRGFYHDCINTNWTPIFDIERSFIYNRKTFQRVQFPLQPSAGRSVHRAQGSTMQSAVIDLSQRKVRKVPHLHYVALSRVTSMKNLQILNFNEQALTVDEQVKEIQALLGLVGDLLKEGMISESCRLTTSFQIYSQDLAIILTFIRMSLGIMTMEDLTPEMMHLLRTPLGNVHRQSIVAPVALLRNSSTISLMSNIQPMIESVTEETEQKISAMEILLGHCEYSKNTCVRILTAFKIALVLEIGYDDVVSGDDYAILGALLKTTCSAKFRLAADFLRTSSLSSEEVAGFLSDAILMSFRVSLGLAIGNQALVFDPSQSFTDFHQIIRLCKNPSILGERLVDTIAGMTVDVEEVNDEVLTLQTEVLILAHDCYTASCDMEGISYILRAARILTAHLEQAHEFQLMTRLLTGVGRYNEMIYIFDSLKQNHQFEQLLGKGLEKESKLKTAILDYLKRYHPADSETYTMVALTFMMYREIAQSLHDNATKILDKLKGKPLENNSDIQALLQKAAQFYSEAAESFIKDSCLRQAQACVRRARLVALQLKNLSTNQQYINLTVKGANLLIADHPVFSEAFIISEAYQQKESWAMALCNNVIVRGDMKYLQEFRSHIRIKSQLIEDAVEKYQLSANKTSQATNNVKKLLQLCKDVKIQYRIAKALNLREVVTSLEKGDSKCYVMDFSSLF